MNKPEGLGPDGSAFWDEIAGPDSALVLRADEYRLLAMASAQLDLLAELEMQFAADPVYVVKGSTGQPVVNPLIGHQDKVMGRFSAICRQLQIPDQDPDRAEQRAAMVSGDMAALGRLSAVSRKASG